MASLNVIMLCELPARCVVVNRGFPSATELRCDIYVDTRALDVANRFWTAGLDGQVIPVKA